MKKIIYIALLCSFLVSLPTGCARLDLDPYNYASENTSFKNKRDAEMWVNGMYNALRDYNQGQQMYASDLQADYLNAAAGAMEKLPDMHRWSTFASSEHATASIWKERFLIIQDINTGIKGFPNIPEQSEIQELTGALYLGRAYCYTYLVTHFCKPYNSSTATTDLGLPLLTTPTLKNFPPRSSVAETYDFILSDIQKAETLLANQTGAAGADTFTLDAARALKARVLLYKNDDNTNELYLGESESFFFPGQIDANPNVLPTQDFIDLFTTDDWRKDVFLKEVTVGFSSLYAVNKYPRNRELEPIDSYNFYYGHKAKLFRIAETYLIAAEAAYKNNDETNAKKYLNLLRAARGLSAITTSGSNLFADIQNERNRELAFEDFRLYDLNRWGLPVKRGTPQDVTAIRNTPASDYSELNIQVGSNYYYKIVWPIPVDDIDYEQGNWKQNPNW